MMIIISYNRFAVICTLPFSLFRFVLSSLCPFWSSLCCSGWASMQTWKVSSFSCYQVSQKKKALGLKRWGMDCEWERAMSQVIWEQREKRIVFCSQVGLGVCGQSRDRVCEGGRRGEVRWGAEPTNQTTRSAEKTQQWITASKNPRLHLIWEDWWREKKLEERTRRTWSGWTFILCFCLIFWGYYPIKPLISFYFSSLDRIVYQTIHKILSAEASGINEKQLQMLIDWNYPQTVAFNPSKKKLKSVWRQKIKLSCLD